MHPLVLPTRGYVFSLKCALLSLYIGDVEGAKKYFADAHRWLWQLISYKSPLL